MLSLKQKSLIKSISEKLNHLQPEIEALGKRNFSTRQREKAAKTGAAMPDGSFPIQNTSDLHNAVQAVGRASNPAKAKAHIKSRAKALGASDQLPESW